MDSPTRCGTQWIQRGSPNATCNDCGFFGPTGIRSGNSQGAFMTTSTMDTYGSPAAYLNVASHAACQGSDHSYASLPSMRSVSTMQEATMKPFPTMQSMPPCQESDGEPWETDDEFDHPRGLGRAETGGGCAPESPPENGQDSAWAGAGGAQPAARERPPSRPGGFQLRGVAGAAPPCSPSNPPGVPPRPAAGAALAERPPGDWARHAQPARARPGVAAPGWGRATRVGWPAGAGRAEAARGALAAASRALEGQRARLSEQEQLLAELQRQAQEIKQSILQQAADLLELELQQGELVGNVLMPIDRAAPAAPSAPDITTLMVRNIPMAVTQRSLLDLIDRSGFANRYDFAYLPTDFDAGTTKGHAFVNFVTPGDAWEFSEMWNGARLTGAGPVAAVLEVGASQLQGYRENARRWSTSRLRRTKNHELHPFIAQRLAAG
ncbi:unnamed protein product [Prorocentrum cordatum]|uniref:RRM domain-containing protein n=1 Tax=Prorocentrum cordatum TaxID=2364126 RepID=A0ABN9W7C6_9DINO|nr:unnamed protein product [Polarella glacialis]